jgi:hypothetical protein
MVFMVSLLGLSELGAEHSLVTATALAPSMTWQIDLLHPRDNLALPHKIYTHFGEIFGPTHRRATFWWLRAAASDPT